MSFSLFQAGMRREPRTVARRIIWGVVTLIPLGVFAGALTTGAVLGWVGTASVTDSAIIWLTVVAALFDLFFVYALVGGTIEVLRQLSRERSERGSSSVRTGKGTASRAPHRERRLRP